MSIKTSPDLIQLTEDIKRWGQELGFQQVGISDLDLRDQKQGMELWLANGYHGEMQYMTAHGDMRYHPEQLHPGALRAITVRMDYLPEDAQFAANLSDPNQAYISRYALGRDYHKLIRNRLKKLAQRIAEQIDGVNARPFVDSAPILERPLAAKAGLGWIGKHSLLLDEQAGSWFFLGELLINLPLPVDTASDTAPGCGNCKACITICPTQAIVEPYVVDARRCISYLTIEHPGIIDEALRPLMGNRIYGCDDCQLICPWNRYAQLTQEGDFSPRQQLHPQKLLDLFAWDEATFLKNTEGSPIRRIGHQRWLRNIAIALGNAPYNEAIVTALTNVIQAEPSEMVGEHVGWAIQQQRSKSADYELRRQTQRLINSVERALPRDA
ncbi:tRNA epoxyqueuosine(34) reductase QueG [Corallincola spongiicola]|uniref:Epoxyqueuosine reductase n=1 Tax=Corallincola spongiicola TaxID=2520508 RepID=A0ABY1WQK9_9GAMM|nr:tRNA epoxyqueuosine(34) reductase QueG [Corallincola spongiicola]TAA47005.1 tRNA epoxyqueuosine(34) reductase QueG [Corallincola spongiicola]